MITYRRKCLHSFTKQFYPKYRPKHNKFFINGQWASWRLLSKVYNVRKNHKMKLFDYGDPTKIHCALCQWTFVFIFIFFSFFWWSDLCEQWTAHSTQQTETSCLHHLCRFSVFVQNCINFICLKLKFSLIS